MNYFSNAFEGRNAGWRYFLLFIASFIGGQLIGGIPLTLIIVLKMFQSGGVVQNPENLSDLSQFGISQNFGLFLMILPFICSILILFFLFKSFHNRHFSSLYSSFGKIRWNRFFISAGIWVLLCAVYLGFDYFFNSNTYQLNFKVQQFVILCIISICLIPIQASTEEVFFRGYMAQGIGVWTRNPLLVILIPSVVFGLMHSLNPEVFAFGFWLVMPQYIFFGLLFGLTTYLDDGIEVAMGAHSANNVFTSIFVTNTSSVLQTPALFVQNEINAGRELVMLLIIGIVFFTIFKYKFKWRFNALLKKIDNPFILKNNF